MAKTFTPAGMTFLFKYRWIIFLLLVILCVVTLPYFKKAITPNNALSIWFKQDDPALKAYYDFQRDFSNDRIISLAYQEPAGVLEEGNLHKLKQFSERLEAIDGIKKVHSVLSAADFRRIENNDVTKIQYTTYFPLPGNYATTGTERKDILNSPLIRNWFLNSDGTVAMLIIELDSVHLVEAKVKHIIPAIINAAVPFPGAAKIHLGGSDIMNLGLNKLSEKDFTLFISLAFAVMLVITFLFYRNAGYVGMVMITNLFAIWASLSVHGMLGYQLQIFSIIAPLLAITVGLIGLLHIINEYERIRREDKKLAPKDAAKTALQNILRPATFATLTSIIGFASLLTSPTAALREFGILSGIGILMMFMFSFLFAAILLPMIKDKQASVNFGFNWLNVLTEKIMTKSLPFVIGTIVLIVLAVAGIRRINVDMNPIGYFPPDHSVVSDHNFLVKHWGEYHPLDLVLESHDSAGMQNVTLIKAIVAFGKEISEYEVVHAKFDFTDIMDRYTRVRFRKPLSEILNDPFVSTAHVEQAMEQLQEKSGGLLTADLRKARITIIGPLLSVKTLEANLAKIDVIARKHFDGLAVLSVSGYPALYTHIMNYAFDSMESSLYSCFILIFLAMLVMLRNLRTATISLIPNLFPVVLLLGFLGYSGINLDLATCTVTAIVLGIAIDDTIYFMHRYRIAKASGMNTSAAIHITHRTVGKVIVISSITLIAGFACLLPASLRTVMYFGLLTIISVVSALLGDLVILPLLLKYIDRK